MLDSNKKWQSDTFKEMLNYERENIREKFIYDSNQVLNLYNNFEFQYPELLNADPQLLSLIFSSISITYSKDQLSDYIRDANLYDCMNPFISINNTLIPTHTFNDIPEKNLDIGEQFSIPKSTLEIYTTNENGNINTIYNLDDWNFNYDHNIISIDNGIITSIRKGSTIVECISDKYNIKRNIKVNSGNIKQAHITEFFFSQIRNIIAHGRFSLANTGAYDTLSEYNSYNMSTFDNRYMLGLQRDIVIYDNNQLNIAYNGENTFNIKYMTYLAQNLYVKDDNPFKKYIEIFDKTNNPIVLMNRIKQFSEEEIYDFKTLLILSKFYINFIYNYDTFDKDNYNYDDLSIKDEVKGNFTNKEFIYEIRTSIMHGRYTYNDYKFNFWNYKSTDNNEKSFESTISYNELINMITSKEEDFYEKMKYNPNKLIGSLKK